MVYMVNEARSDLDSKMIAIPNALIEGFKQLYVGHVARTFDIKSIEYLPNLLIYEEVRTSRSRRTSEKGQPYPK